MVMPFTITSRGSTFSSVPIHCSKCAKFCAVGSSTQIMFCQDCGQSKKTTPDKTLNLVESFEVFMQRKPKKMRNIYWRAYKAAWVAALELKA